MKTKSLTLSLLGLPTLALAFFRLPSTRTQPRLMMSSTGFTGSTLTDDALAHEAMSYFVKGGNLKFQPTSGGVNNVVQYVETPQGDKYILRIYNNGFDTNRVKFEHEILKQLNQQEYSFKIPKMLPSLQDSSKTYVTLSNGAEACLVEVIPGYLPKLTCVEDIGRASGELGEAISKVKLDLKSPNPPYYDIFAAHHAVDRESFLKEMETPAFDATRQYATKMAKDIVEMEERVARYRDILPNCLIHGDLHYDNVLVQDGKVTGLLDFEFCAFDWKAMELAVCLSKYAGEKEAMSYFDQFITGFVKHGRLSRKEIEAIPELVNLRILSNVVYFVGRKLGNEDTIDALTTRIESYSNRVDWVRANGDKIVENIYTKMKREDPTLA